MTKNNDSIELQLKAIIDHQNPDKSFVQNTRNININRATVDQINIAAVNLVKTATEQATNFAGEVITNTAVKVHQKPSFNAQSFTEIKQQVLAPFIIQGFLAGLGVPEDQILDLSEQIGKLINPKIKLTPADQETLKQHQQRN